MDNKKSNNNRRIMANNRSSNMDRDIRKLEHTKAPRTVIGRGAPNLADGNDGDFQIRSTSSGLKLFIKYTKRCCSGRFSR